MKDFLNTVSNPGIFLFPLLLIFIYLLAKPRFWSIRIGAVFFCAIGTLFAISMSDARFRKIFSEPDNIPPGALLLLLAFFLWVGLSQAHENDRRASSGKPPVEKEFKDKVATWPDLVYIELISMVLLTSLLLVWSLLANAPLEEWANPAISPNPSKAPWYFLGLQELLVYFDPWIAGVIIPTLIVFGLMAIPYLDSSPAGSGYYSFSGRKFALLCFLGGFFFWVVLIAIGTFLRGKNWAFYGPFEERELVKNNAVRLVNLSDVVWKKLFSVRMPSHWLPREIFGITLLLFYLFFLPLFIRKTVTGKREKNSSKRGLSVQASLLVKHLKPTRGKRHLVTLILFFLAGGILIKILLRLLFGIKYVVYLPEYLLNI